MDEWVAVADLAQLPQDAPALSVAVKCGGLTVALFRVHGEYFALDDVCSHEYSRLSEGEILDGEVYCPKHGSRFDLRTGEVRGLPATEPVRAYKVKEEGGKVWVRCSASPLQS
jgi:3-phenylpropionate/trans-cinnamate dioxygenase ferredoxin subunit